MADRVAIPVNVARAVAALAGEDGSSLGKIRIANGHLLVASAYGAAICTPVSVGETEAGFEDANRVVVEISAAALEEAGKATGKLKKGEAQRQLIIAPLAADEQEKTRAAVSSVSYAKGKSKHIYSIESEHSDTPFPDVTSLVGVFPPNERVWYGLACAQLERLVDSMQKLGAFYAVLGFPVLLNEDGSICGEAPEDQLTEDGLLFRFAETLPGQQPEDVVEGAVLEGTLQPVRAVAPTMRTIATRAGAPQWVPTTTINATNSPRVKQAPTNSDPSLLPFAKLLALTEHATTFVEAAEALVGAWGEEAAAIAAELLQGMVVHPELLEICGQAYGELEDEE